MVLLGVGFGWFGWKLREAERQRKAVEAIERVGGVVWYDAGERQWAAWLGELAGEDYFSDVIGVGFSYPTFSYPQLVGDADLQDVHRLAGLEFLDLRATQVTDEGVERLMGLTKLKRLELDGTQVTDAGLEHLSRLTRLRELSLNGTQITDDGLENLKGLVSLEALYLTDTQVRDEEIKELRKALPNCKIYWDDPQDHP